MPGIFYRHACLSVVAASTLIAGCSTFNNLTQSVGQTFSGGFSPYTVEVVQGNFVSKEQVAALQPGMSRQQVRDILGTPLLASVFHADRWDYVFTLKRKGVEDQARKLAVYFKGDAMTRAEGDEMPSEAEFVASLDNRRKSAKVPALEASEEALKAFAEKSPAPVGAAPVAPVGQAPVAYPPLESPTR